MIKDTNSENLKNKVVTRFAPSPTGFMHAGGIRTAIFAYLWARKNNGTFILRIEDTDKAREVPGSFEHILECFKWLELEYDYGPFKENPFGSAKQSERLEVYIKWAKLLEEKGFAYPDTFTEEEIEKLRKKAEEEKRPFLIREHRKEITSKWDGKSPLRFKVPVVKRYTWNDEIRGELTSGEEALDDFILIKADGFPTYNFSHIIDDFEMGVNYVIRGQEFISSTPKFLSLYDALGFPYPKFATVPPILREDRTKKLGKRDGAKDLLDYKKEGYLASAMFNFLTLLGWHPSDERELFTKEELVNIFELSRIQKGGATFDDEKLLWINREHIRKMNPSSKLDFVESFLNDNLKQKPFFSRDVLHKSVNLIIDHARNGSEIKNLADSGELDYLFDMPKYDKLLLLWKNENIEDTKKRIESLNQFISSIEESAFESSEKLKEVVFPFAQKEGTGQMLWPLRVLLSGLEKSPDPFSLMHILGKKRTLDCIDLALKML